MGASDWREVKDKASGKTYYYNKVTKKTSWKRPAEMDEAAPAAAAPAAKSDWKELKDKASGKTYYYNKATKATSWKKPADFGGAAAASPSPAATAKKPAAAAAGGLPPNWREVKDKASGKVYYYNSKTKKTSWKKPAPEAGAEPAAAAAASPKTPKKKKKKEVAPAGPLPPNWKEVKDPGSGKTYFYNQVTKKTSWKKKS